MSERARPPARGLRDAIRRRTGRRGERAVTEVLGNMLVVAITVLMMGSLAVLVARQPGPIDTEHADLAIALARGDATWGNGNEKVLVDHLGGEQLRRDSVKIIVRIEPTTTEYVGVGLLGDFADGLFTTGDNWNQTYTVAANQRVDVDVFADNARLVATASLLATQSCALDGAPPLAAPLVQSPADVRITTLGAVTVDVTLGDDCSGVDEATAPNLLYRINDGSNPAFTDLGDMLDAGLSAWRGTIPDPVWALQGTKTLEWKVSGYRDLAGNAGESAVQADIVSVVGTAVFATNSNPVTGAVGNFTRMQSAADAGAEADVREAAVVPPPATLAFATDAVVTAGTGWSGATVANLAASDDLRATNSNNNPGVLEVGHANPAPPSGTVTRVVLKAEVSITAGDDRFRLQACLSGACSAQSADLGAGSLLDETVAYDVTALRPGGGAWSWADINGLQDRLALSKGANNARDGTWQVDRMWIEVTYQPPASYALNVEFTFNGVLAGAHYLDLRYRTDGDDSFQVQVWDSAALAWNTRATLSGTGLANVTVLLSAPEYALLDPNVRVRLVDSTPGGTAGGVAYLDWMRVITA